MALEKKVFEALWSFGEYKFALYRYLLSPILVFVKTYLPSVSALNAIVTASKVHRVMTPLLPPVPMEMLTKPFQMLSRRAILVLWVSCINTIACFVLILFLILPMACNSQMSLVRPLQLIEIISNLSMSGPGFGYILLIVSAMLISSRVLIRLIVQILRGTGTIKFSLKPR